MNHRPLELHYFRLPRRRWELALLRLRQLGADAVCTPVPWAWHQPSPHRHDFTGVTHPGRDVVDFLEVCRDLQLPVWLRVGPYVGAGLLSGGVPPWLMHQTPAIHALGPDRQPLRDRQSGSPLPTAEHPACLEHVTGWYRLVTEALAAFQQPDGPICAVQTGGPALYEVATADLATRPGLIHDYNTQVGDVLWPVWLRQRYDGIGALNAAWGAGYSSFNDVPLPDEPATSSSGQAPAAAAAQFIEHVVARAEATYASLLREMGWRAPVLAGNELPPWGDTLPAHVMTTDAEPPEISASVAWATDAPVRADGSARRRFWEIKAVWLAARAGERPAPNALVVTRADNGTVRLPRRLAGAAAFRLLLDGRLLAVTHAEPTLATRLDYVVEDQLGETDMFIVCDDPATPLTGWPADYLRQLLRSTSHRLRRAAAMCRAVVETLAGASPAAAGVPRTALPDDSLAASASGLAEAHMAVQRAARSVYRLETLRNAVLARSVPAASEPAAPEWLLSAEQMALLKPVEAACAQAALLLSQASERPKVAELTLAAYQTSRRQADAARESARALLQPALAGLRADLASGALPPTLALLQAWLVDVLTVADLGPASQ